MKNVNYLFLIFPVSVFVAAFLVLAVNLFPAKIGQIFADHQESRKSNPPKPATEQGAEKALPYFILASVFMVLILVLPRLQELSISEKSIVLKLISDVKEDARLLQAETTVIQQESLKTSPTNDKAIRIQEKLNILEQLLHQHK